ncbi:MAG: hypothetical protein KBC02_03225 [Candidatus Pacebacteria bacterium]|nr:hypothetical protein [Candidatus Paceibacterota bacterium]
MTTIIFILSAAMLVCAFVLIWKAAGLTQKEQAHEPAPMADAKLNEKSRPVSNRLRMLLAKIDYLDEETIYDELPSDEARIHSQAITAEVMGIYDACHNVGEVHGDYTPWLERHTTEMVVVFSGLLEWGERYTIVELILDQLESRGVCENFLNASFDLSFRMGFAPDLTKETIAAYYQAA